jgi:hypothetical protein
MIMDQNSIILVAAICIVIGFLIGRLVSSLGEERESASLDSQNAVILKVRREPDDDELRIELDDKEYEKSIKLNAKQRKQMRQIILDLNDWLESKAIPKTETVDVTPTEEYLTDQEAPGDTKPRISFNPVNMLFNALRADVPKSQLPTESIVIQIDDILQEKLKNAPHITDPVRLMEWPDKGMVVMIGLDKFDSVDDVVNDEIKDMIRSAVKEWEKRAIEGME